MRTPTAFKPLDHDELLILDRFIEDESAMALYEFWGFIAGLVSHPETIPPSQWLPLILRDDNPFEATEEANRILELIMRFWNRTANDFRQDRPILPVYEPEGLLEWCRGYLDGMLIDDEWINEYEEGHAPTVPFEVYLMLNERDAAGSEPLTEKEREVLEALTPEYLESEAVLAYRALKKKRQQVMRERNKWTTAGRNDPCPCGSGKKYKKCCLNQRPQ